MLGLALYGAGFPSVGACVQLGLVQIALLIAFSLYMRRLKVFGMPIFAMFPVILAIGITWLYGERREGPDKGEVWVSGVAYCALMGPVSNCACGKWASQQLPPMPATLERPDGERLVVC